MHLDGFLKKKFWPVFELLVPVLYQKRTHLTNLSTIFEFSTETKSSKTGQNFFSKSQESQSHDFDFFQISKKVKVMTLTFFKGPLENTFRRFL
jgi:hypothetical protein